jgi:hypothetical protein
MGPNLASTSSPSLKTETEPVSRILYAWCELQAIVNVLTSQNMLHDCFPVLYTSVSQSLGPGVSCTRLSYKKEFTGLQSHRGWEPLLYTVLLNIRISSRSPSGIAHRKLVALHGLMLIYVWFKISLINILCSVYSHNAAFVICQQLHVYYHMSFFTHVFHSSYMSWLYITILRYIICCKLLHCNPYWGKHKLKLIES